jgi:DNA topoisomerase-3
LDGFTDRRGRTYKGVLALQGKEVVLKPVAGSEQSTEAAEFEVNPEPLCRCPVHEDCFVIESPIDYVCQQRKAQQEAGTAKPTGVVLPRVVCRRPMLRDEAKKLFETGETDLIEDFVSRYGKPFSARLKLRDDGRHQFEFPNREGRAQKPGAKKKSARVGSTSKKTSAKKTAAKKSASKSPRAHKTSKKPPAN